MGFKDLSEFFDPDLYLKIDGKVYRVPAANADRALRLRQMFAARAFGAEAENREAMELLGAEWVTETVKVPVFDDGKASIGDDGEPVTRDVIIGKWVGGVYQEMTNDGLSAQQILHAGLTAVSDAAFGREQAENYWETAILGESAEGDADPGNPLPPLSGVPTAASKKTPAKKVAKRTTSTKRSSKASTASTTPARARTAKTTRAAGTTTP